VFKFTQQSCATIETFTFELQEPVSRDSVHTHIQTRFPVRFDLVSKFQAAHMHQHTVYNLHNLSHGSSHHVLEACDKSAPRWVNESQLLYWWSQLITRNGSETLIVWKELGDGHSCVASIPCILWSVRQSIVQKSMESHLVIIYPRSCTLLDYTYFGCTQKIKCLYKTFLEMAMSKVGH
jgi:glutathione peroxidase-family protein